MGLQERAGMGRAMILTKEQVAEIRVRAKQVNIGEWEAVLNDDPRGQPVPYYRGLVCFVENSPDRHIAVVSKDGGTITKEQWPVIAELVASAPALLDTLADRDAKIEALEKALTDAMQWAAALARAQGSVAHREVIDSERFAKYRAALARGEI